VPYAFIIGRTFDARATRMRGLRVTEIRDTTALEWTGPHVETGVRVYGVKQPGCPIRLQARCSESRRETGAVRMTALPRSFVAGATEGNRVGTLGAGGTGG